MAIDRTEPSAAELASYLTGRRNWGRWGEDDQRGAINLITPEKRAGAAGLVRCGRIVSLSRDFPTVPSPDNPNPALHYMRAQERGTGGSSSDFVGIQYHGFAATHIDALCHMWGADGMWNGRDPAEQIGFDGAHWGAIDNWREGIVTRGVLLDVPAYRGEPFVTRERPVHAWELEEIAEAQGVSVEPGDAIVVHSGRDAMLAHDPQAFVGPARPGLHASCLRFLRDHDVAVLAWDMMDHVDTRNEIVSAVHGAIYAYGVALVDNCTLGALAQACAEEGRYEFMLTVAPLAIIGGTGSPANPLALF